MKKTTKGALAAGAAAVLLLGGAGTIAYWTAEATVEAGSLEAGSMTLSDVACGETWQEDGADVALIVPGDTLRKTCTGTLVLEGDHIGATVALDDASVTTAEAAFGGEVDIDASMTAPAAAVIAPGSHAITVVITAAFDATLDNDETFMNATATLNALELTAVQTHDTAA